MDKLTLYRGLTFQLEIPVRDKTSALVDLTGYGAELAIKSSPDDPDPGLLELAVGSGITIANQVTQRGYMLVEVAANVTNALAVGDCWFDVIVIDLLGRRKHVVENREIEIRNPVNHLGTAPGPSTVSNSAFGSYVKKATAGSLLPGQPVYVAGYAFGFILVEPVKAGSTPQAFAIMTASATDTVAGYAAATGDVSGVNTTGMVVGEKVYTSFVIGGVNSPLVPSPVQQEIGTVASVGALGAITIGVRAMRLVTVADWPLGMCRYFLVDNDAGSDGNVGYIDAIPGSDLTGLTSGVALKTEERLREILPKLGGGRVAVVLWKARAGGANFLAKDGANDYIDHSDITGYGYFLRRGSLDLSNTVADRIHLGYITAVAGPNGDDSWTVGVGSTTGNIVVSGGAFPAENAAGVSTATGYRIRWITGALAGTAENVVASNDTGAIVTERPLTSAPTSGDTFVIDKPGVRFASVYDGSLVNSNSQPPVSYSGMLVGVCITNASPQRCYTFSVSGGRNILVGVECNGGAVSTLMIVGGNVARFTCASIYFDEVQGGRKVGFGIRNSGTSNISASQGISMQSVYEVGPGRSYINGPAQCNINTGGGGYLGAGSYLSLNGGSAAGATLASGSSSWLGRSQLNTARCRVAGVGFSVIGCVSIRGVEFVNCGANPKIVLQGTGSSMTVDDCVDSGASSGVLVDLSAAFFSTVSMGAFRANTHSASPVDVNAAGQVFPMASLAAAPARDKQGNVIIGAALVGPCVTASLPAAGDLPNGSQVIEDAGAARNMVLYENSQRFRFTGGAAF